MLPGVMTAAAASLLLVLTVCLTVAQLPRPQGAGETLSVAGAAVAAVAATVWRPRCSVILLTDGTTSSTTVFTRPLLKVTAEEFPPHVEVRETANTSGPRFRFSGAMTRVLELLALSLNFTYTIIRPPDGSFGTKLSNGTATGMVGMVGRKEIDLGLGPFGITAVRAEIVDYTAPIVNDYLRILGGRGKPEVDPWGFLLPLAPAVWAVMLASLVLLLTTVLLLSFCFSVRVPMLSMYFRVLLQENTWVSSDRWWERMVLGGWMIVMLVLTLSYSGNLMSLLAVRYIPQPFQFLRDLLEDPSTTMIWEYNTAYVNHFRTSESGIFQEVQKAEAAGRISFVLATEYPTMQDQLVREGPYVFVGEDLTIKVLMGQDFSNTEAGLYDYWMESLNRNSTVCVRPPTKITVRTSLSLSNIWELGGLGAPWGVTVFQVAAEGKSPNMTEALLSRLVAQARRVRQVSWCVTVVVVSDDSAFLAASAEWIFKGRLLVWTNRLLAVTRRPLSHLRHLHTSFSMMNAMLLLLDDTSDYPRCSVYVHLPYSSQVLQVASWAPHLGLSLTTNIPLFPEKFDRYQYSGAMIKVLELLAHSINFT
ncbi:Glutamate receptor ionotropic, delta-2-like 11 [Homarus americanus]|uniref:Glutamate receptor ionotropic, delta-2-like 11 n=1 Tax=Homarus americanus TaxID=6706 RepID=A0A8J5JJ95_HOMAM|nr:Glutamate receptor ionotropic, delta-2-like 11 [Homarus americanus]